MSQKLTAHNRALKNAADKRRQAMQALKDRGWTLEQIGKEHKCSRQRVFQILNPETSNE